MLFKQAEIAALNAKISHVTGLYFRAKRETRRYADTAARAMAAAENGAARGDAAATGSGSRPPYQGHYSNSGEDSDDQLQFRINGIDGHNDSRKNGFYNQYHLHSADGM